MKFIIVLFAVVAAATAYPGHPWAAPVAQPWPAPDPWAGAAPWQPSYAKVIQPSYVKVAAPQVHAPQVHQVLQIPQQHAIPNPHPQPLHLNAPHTHVGRVAVHPNPIVKPHLIAVEQYIEPVAKPVLVKTPVSHGWA